jgi:hypothetical protein
MDSSFFDKEVGTMKIGSYYMQASAERSYTAVETVTQVTSQHLLPYSPNAATGSEGVPEAAELALSEEGKKALEQLQAPTDAAKDADVLAMRAKSAARNRALTAYSPQQARLDLLQELLQRLTGKKFVASAIRLGNPTRSAAAESEPKLRVTNTEYRIERYESETLSYSAQGIIHTADGKTISVNVNLNMQREYAAVFTGSFTNTDVVLDPLVINYAGMAASLTDEKFDFDLDLDGKSDRISFTGAGSGFLALDKNGDGRINDGAELFGPQTGSGFGELRNYDEDGNGWIDENDGIFARLLVWSKDKDGNDQLFRLQEVDVGAIFLGDIGTEYTLGARAGDRNGVIRSTSVFLKESGGAGSIQHVDISI